MLNFLHLFLLLLLWLLSFCSSNAKHYSIFHFAGGNHLASVAKILTIKALKAVFLFFICFEEGDKKINLKFAFILCSVVSERVVIAFIYTNSSLFCPEAKAENNQLANCSF